MSVEARFGARVVFEVVLTLADWGLTIAAVILLFSGQSLLAMVLFVGGMLAFFISAKSFKSKPSSQYLDEARKHDGLG